MGGRMRCSEAGGHLARSAASGRSPKAGGRGLQLLSEGVGRESKFSTVIIGMAMPSLSTWALEATEVYCWFPHPKEYTHTRMHAEHSCLAMLTEWHGPYLPSWSAKLPLQMEETSKQRLLWKKPWE